LADSEGLPKAEQITPKMEGRWKNEKSS